MGGRGVLDLRMRHKNQLERLRTYSYEKATTSTLYETVINPDKNFTPLNLADRHGNLDEKYSVEALNRHWQEKDGYYSNCLQ